MVCVALSSAFSVKTASFGEALQNHGIECINRVQLVSIRDRRGGKTARSKAEPGHERREVATIEHPGSNQCGVLTARNLHSPVPHFEVSFLRRPHQNSLSIPLRRLSSADYR